MTKPKLPLGIQTFRQVREGDFYYVDKTGYIQRLVTEGKHYFLSRPRRFGKSLLLDTIKELFEGNEPLFRNLDIHARWNWSVRHPVLRLDFAAGNFRKPDYLYANLMAQLDVLEERIGVATRYDTPAERFGHLIRTASEQAVQPAVVLVDEYDQPIVDALDKPLVARANRDDLRGLYSVIKSHDADIRFSLLTGVSKFSKASLFSGLNNLSDITVDRRYATVCGYTDNDLDTVFAIELQGLDRQAIREWYNGYDWRGSEKVYNPFDILLLFDRREFGAHWFETGSPAFLIETLLKRRVHSLALEEMMGAEDLLSRFDVEDIATEALLFQTGYLTIAEEKNLGGKTLYRLGYPNREVKQGLNEQLLRTMGPDRSRQGMHDVRLYELLEANDFSSLEALFRAFFASIPYEWYINNDIANYEGYYASVFYSWFAALRLDTTVEDSSSHGRLDMAVRFQGSVYLFEFKVVELAPSGSAMAQLKAKRYADKYRGSVGPVWLIGVEFSRETRNLVSLDVERAKKSREI